MVDDSASAARANVAHGAASGVALWTSAGGTPPNSAEVPADARTILKPVPRFHAIRASLGASALRRRIIGGVAQEANHVHAHGRPAAIVIDERSAPRLAMAVGEVWGAADAGGEGAAAVTRDCGAEARREHVISASLVAAVLILGLCGGRWQAENSAQVGAHAGPPGGWLTESPRGAHPMFGAGAATSSGAGDPTMRPTSYLTAAALATTINAAMSAGALAGDAVQWRVEDGGNGHWYRVIVLPGAGYPRITWDEARNRAIAAGGYLATVSTIEENAFLFRDVSPTMFNQWSCWIGGLRTGGGGWQWVNGEPFSCDTMPGCPFCCGENRLYTGQYGSGPYLWIDDHNNDFQGGKNEYLIEWSADCNNDGIVDYGQIRDGTFADTNANGVLDCCESAQSCCIGDIYIDGRINGADLGIVLSEWGPVTPTTNSDLDGNGRVDGADLGLLLSHWGPCGG